jgi:thioredoxin-related protein
MKSVIVMISFMLIRLTLFCQEVAFTKGLSWRQILNKAKLENKYIFVDCYTTWCGPCKRMEKEVFTVDSIATYMNSHFIAVRSQMDQSSKDDQGTKNWYKDAKEIDAKYKIQAFPTFLFFAPDGRIVDRQTGFRQPDDFLSMVKKSGSLKETYKDPYAEYYALLDAYEKGKRDLKKMPYMIKKSRELADPMYSKLAREYLDYLETLPKDKLFTKDNLDFLGTIMTSGNRFFPLFLSDGEEMDKVMGSGSFTKNILYRIIHAEEVLPHLREMALRVWPPYFETIHANVARRYPEAYADWAVNDAKVVWFEARDQSAYIDVYLTQIEKYGIDTTIAIEDVDLNNHLWIVFLKSTDTSQLKRAIKLMEGVIRRNCCRSMAFIWDTYANLLYKAGRTKDAIAWEEKALEQVKSKEFYSPDAIDNYSDILNKMKNNLPTWLP